MKFTMEATFYEKTNWLSRTLLFIGFFFVDLGMKASGMEEK